MTVAQDQLKPCPFCGSTETSHGYSRVGVFELGNCECHNCNACICADTEAEAITAWNTRASEDAERPMLERIEALEAENAMVVEFVRGLECECDSYHAFTCGRCRILAKQLETACLSQAASI